MFHNDVARGPVNRNRMRQRYHSAAVLGVFTIRAAAIIADYDLGIIIDSSASDISIVSAASADCFICITQ